jgi:uncharacterized membrane protein
MRINSSIVIRAPRELIWNALTDPDRYPEFMSGITRWELVGDTDGTERPERIELGSRIRMLIRVGSAEIGGLIEIVEAKGRSDMAWSSVTGIDQRGRWRLRDAGRDCTRVELRYSYGIAGAGITGVLAERVGAPILRRRLRQSLYGLKRMVEQERLRQEGAERRRRARAQPIA